MKTNSSSFKRASSLPRTILSASAASLVVAAVGLPQAAAQFISLTGATTYTQNFDLLGTATIPWVDNTTIPGWHAGINANATGDGNAQVSDGAADLAGLLNLGTTGNADRTLGSKVTSTNAFANAAFGVLFKNDSALTLDITNISYVGELWRGNSVAGVAENWTTFTKISSTVFTDVEPGPNANVANVGTFTAAPATLNWASTNNVVGQLNGNLAINRAARSADPNLLLAPGQFFMFRWVDTNNANSDGAQGIDDFSISFLTLPNNLVYDRNHAVGGFPDGIVAIGAGNYWLKSGVPTGLTLNDNVFFSQPGSSTLSVPTNVALNEITISATSGTYTFNGPGGMSGALIKSGAGGAVLGNPNTFSGLTLSDVGVLQATVPQSVSGEINLPFNPAGTPTLQTDADVTAAFINGTELLTKTGAGALVLTGLGASGATGGILVSAGTLRTLTADALGPQNIGINGAGAALSFAHAAGDQTLNAATTITPGAAGAEINVANGAVGVGVIIGTADRLIGANTITKTGPGILRMSADQASFTGNWIINGGAVQYGNALLNALGSGSVTINTGGELAGQNTIVPVANITLNGGALGTRTGVLTDFTGTVNVVANSEARLRSVSTPTGTQAFTISGVLTGAGDLMLTGNLPLTDSGGTAQLRLTNTANTFTGTFHATQFQTLTSEAVAGTGSALNGRPVLLSGGRLRLLDNGAADNGTITFGNNVTVDSGVASVDVDRQAAGTFSGNTIQLGTLAIAGGSTLGSTGGNSYQAHFTGLTTVTGAGDVTFSPTTAPLILAGGIGGGTYGIVKNGTGVFGINGNASYTGNTTVNEGTFGTNGQLTGTPRIDIGTGATLDVSLVAGGFNVGAAQTLAGSGSVTGSTNLLSGGTIEGGNPVGVGTLTTGPLALGAGAIVRAAGGNALGSIAVSGTGTLSTSGAAASVTVNVFGAQPALGNHILIDYDGAIGGTGFPAFQLGTLPPRTIATLVDNAGDSVALNVSSIDFPVWSGKVGSEWSTAAIVAPQNWALNSNLATGTDFLVDDRVRFDDTATTTIVDISVADVLPQEAVFDNLTKAYTLQGSRGIAGLIGITKNGNGSATSLLTITNTNSFTGPVTMNGGTVSVAVVADSGIASPLGAGTSLVFNGGTLEYTGAAGTTNRAATIDAGGGTLKTATALTLAGVIGGTGDLTKSGSGVLTLTGLSTFSGAVNINGGTVSVPTIATFGVNSPLGTGTAMAFDGGTLDYTGAVVTTLDRNITINGGGATLRNVANLTASGFISGTGGLTKVGAGAVILSGAVDNTYSGDTRVTQGELILSSPSGINSIGGNLIVETGATASYGTTAGQLQDHIPDTASITITGGTFGSGSGNTEAGPTAGVSDTVANVSVSSGRFLSGRGAGGVANVRPTPFVITGALEMTGGTALVSRGGWLTANSVEIASPAVLNLDGGSATPENQSRLTVGAGGLSLTGATINFNAGPSGVGATSVGSVVTLNGTLTSTGTSSLARLSPTLSTAIVDLDGAVRTFDVSGILTVAPDVGTLADLAAGGILKTGAGKLALTGAQNYASLTNNAGRTDVSTTIGTGTSTVTANAGEVNFGASQTLTSLDIGNGAVVTIGSPLPPAPEQGLAFDAEFAGAGAVAAVPEPGSAALLFGGIATLLGIRRRRA